MSSDQGVCTDLDCSDCVDKAECCWTRHYCQLGNECSDAYQDCNSFVSSLIWIIISSVVALLIVLGLIYYMHRRRRAAIQAANDGQIQQATYENVNTVIAPPTYQQQKANEAPPSYQDNEKYEFTDLTSWFEAGIDGLEDDDKKKYVNIFIENGCENVVVIKGLTDQDLEKMGVGKLGHRKAILMAIERL